MTQRLGLVFMKEFLALAGTGQVRTSASFSKCFRRRSNLGVSTFPSSVEITLKDVSSKQLATLK